jgi:hypothetical protein
MGGYEIVVVSCRVGRGIVDLVGEKTNGTVAGVFENNGSLCVVSVGFGNVPVTSPSTGE